MGRTVNDSPKMIAPVMPLIPASTVMTPSQGVGPSRAMPRMSIAIFKKSIPNIAAVLCRLRSTFSGARPARARPIPARIRRISPGYARGRGHARYVAIAPATCSKPTATNVPSISGYNGEHTTTW
jgi:hypothetical protein